MSTVAGDQDADGEAGVGSTADGDQEAGGESDTYTLNSMGMKSALWKQPYKSPHSIPITSPCLRLCGFRDLLSSRDTIWLMPA